jgi:hypothetical protein
MNLANGTYALHCHRCRPPQPAKKPGNLTFLNWMAPDICTLGLYGGVLRWVFVRIENEHVDFRFHQYFPLGSRINDDLRRTLYNLTTMTIITE